MENGPWTRSSCSRDRRGVAGRPGRDDPRPRVSRRAPSARLGETLAVDGVPLHFADVAIGPPVIFVHGAKARLHRHPLDRPASPAAPSRRLRPRRRLQRRRRRPAARRSSRPSCCTSPCTCWASSARSSWPTRRAPVALALALGHRANVAAVVTLEGYVFSVRDRARADRLLTLPVLALSCAGRSSCRSAS